MKTDIRIELFFSILAYSNGNWPFEDVKEAYEFIKKEMGTENIPNIVKFPSDIEKAH